MSKFISFVQTIGHWQQSKKKKKRNLCNSRLENSLNSYPRVRVASGILRSIANRGILLFFIRRNDYHQVNEQDPYLPPSAASQAIAARTLRGQGSYPPTAPPLNPNAHGNHTIKQPLLLTPPPPSYATATARARQMHESMSKFVHDYFFTF